MARRWGRVTWFPWWDLPLLPGDIPDRIAKLLAPWLRKPTAAPAPRSAPRATVKPLEGLAARRMKAFAEGGLRRQKAIVSEMDDGGRGHALNRMMVSLGIYVKEEILSHEKVVAAGLEACAANGLLAERGVRDILAMIERGLAYADCARHDQKFDPSTVAIAELGVGARVPAHSPYAGLWL